MHVVVVPRNGYINRLQAMASSQLLARFLGASFSVCWLPENAAPAPFGEIFESRNDLSFMSETDLISDLGISLTDVPLYVNETSLPNGGSLATLAGHDRGEQPLIDAFMQSIERVKPEVAVIIAGGRFSLAPGSQPVSWDNSAFRSERSHWYHELVLNASIEAAVSGCDKSPFIGLHLRYSDRSHQTPNRREIKRAVLKVSHESGIRRIFVASDSRKELSYWHEELTRLGLQPWSFEPGAELNGAYSSDVHALIDWRILGNAQALVYFAQSSFGYEAAVAAGAFAESTGLEPNAFLSVSVTARHHVRNVLSAPRRRGWLG